MKDFLKSLAGMSGNGEKTESSETPTDGRAFHLEKTRVVDSNGKRLSTNRSPRTLATLAIDTSGSMEQAGPAVEDGIRRYFEDVGGNELARYGVETTIVTFNDATTVIGPLSAGDAEVPSLSFGGRTNMVEAIDVSCDVTEESVRRHNEEGIPIHGKFLFLISDGQPDPPRDCTAAIKRLKKLEKDMGLLVFPVSAGNAALEFLNSVSAKRKAKALDQTKWAEFFKWISQFLIRTSESQKKPGSSVEVPPTQGWEKELAVP